MRLMAKARRKWLTQPSMQDIPKTTDHAPANTFHTFKVSLPAAQRQLLVNMLKGASNLVDRMEFELNQRPDVRPSPPRVSTGLLEYLQALPISIVALSPNVSLQRSELKGETSQQAYGETSLQNV